jgi:hypothetical protein
MMRNNSRNLRKNIRMLLLKSRRRIEYLYYSGKEGICDEILEQSMGARN